jgi:ketosteroid isomerase-like protein
MSDYGSVRDVAAEIFERMADDDRRDTIGELLADDVVVTIPGQRFEGANAAAELLDAFGGRYEWAAKRFDRWHETPKVAVSQGTLYGTDNDGEDFADIRYVDVFEVEDGLVVRWDIYNDLAAEGVVDVD